MIKLERNGKTYVFDKVEELKEFEKEMDKLEGIRKNVPKEEYKTKIIKVAEKIRKSEGKLSMNKEFIKEFGRNMSQNDRTRIIQALIGKLEMTKEGKTKKEIEEWKTKEIKGIKKKWNLSPERKDYMTQRGLFVAKRANHYMKTLNWTREKAFVQASEDWRMFGKGLQKPETEEKKIIIIKENMENINMPEIYPISKVSQEELKHTIEYSVNNRKPLTMEILAMNTELCGEKEWNETNWKIFCYEFIKNSDKIAKSLKIRNGFRLTRNEKEDIIIYE